MSLVRLKMLSTTGGPLTGAWLEPAGRSCVMSGQPVRAYVLATSGGVHNHVTAVGDSLVIVQARTIDGAVQIARTPQRQSTSITVSHPRDGTS
jgi:hypothetical protein